MKHPLLTTTQVRQNFFSLLRRVEKGEEVFFVKKGENRVFKISLLKRSKSKRDFVKTIEKIQKIGVKAPPQEVLDEIRGSRFLR